MFGRAIWDQLPKCISENSEIARVKRGQFQNFQKSQDHLSPKNCLNQACDYWLITPNQHFVLKLIYFNYYKSASQQLENSRQLQNNIVNSAMSITANRVINQVT